MGASQGLFSNPVLLPTAAFTPSDSEGSLTSHRSGSLLLRTLVDVGR